MTALQGEVALVTGASRGIGAAIATELAARGAVVIGTATSESGRDAIVGSLPPSCAAFVYDASNADGPSELLSALAEAGKTPSILVNNAAITRDTLLMRMSDDDWGAVMSTNLDAVFRLSKGVMRSMIKARAGRIINVTSIVGVMGNAGQANYAAAKAGVKQIVYLGGLLPTSENLSRHLGSRREVERALGAHGVPVTTLRAGMVAGPGGSSLHIMLSLVRRLPLIITPN